MIGTTCCCDSMPDVSMVKHVKDSLITFIVATAGALGWSLHSHQKLASY